MSSVPDPTNADLHRTGRKYNAHRARLADRGKKAATWVAVAAASGVDPKAVLAAVKFADAVDRINANCGRSAKRLLLSDHPRLPARVMMKIGRTHADRQRFALAQARGGRNPFGKPPAGVDPPFDTHDPAEVISRLCRNAGALDRAADGLLDAPTTRWPSADERAGMLADLDLVRECVRRMRPLVASGAIAPSGRPSRPAGRKDRHEAAPFAPARARSQVSLVAGVTRKNARDLPRVLVETPPTGDERARMLARLDRLDSAAARFITVLRAGPGATTGPTAEPGTYVVIIRHAEPVTGLVVGALGTFDFPAGYYAYLGSAHGGGGVRARTHRHLTTVTPRKWNIDHLKPLCTPVAVWWTHDPAKVEFAWAEVLGSMPGASFPAPRFGAADNAKAQAHLVRFARMPSVAEFRRRVVTSIRGHAPVHERRVEGWAGRGWPG